MSSADVLNDLNAALQQQPAENAAPATVASPAGDVLSDIAKAQGTTTAAASNTPSGQLLPAAPYGATDAAVHGLSLGLSDAGRAGIIALGRYLRGDTPDFDYSQAAKEVNRGREAYAGAHPVASAASNLVGGFAGMGGPAGIAVQSAGPVGQVIRSALTGGLMGGVQGAADNNTSVSDALQGAKRGAEAGTVIGGAIPAATNALLPSVSPAVQALRAQGIEPPMGTAAGGIPATIENILANIPIAGAPVQRARASARGQFDAAVARNAESFNRDAINAPLAPIGESLNPNTAIGNDAIEEMAHKVRDAYQQAVPAAGGAIDRQFQQDMIDAINNARLALPAERADQFGRFINTKIISQAQNGTLSGQAFKDAESDLSKFGRITGNSTSDERNLAEAYRRLNGDLRDWLMRANPQAAPDLQAANTAYRLMLPVQDAAASTPTGELTAQNLLNASRKFGGRVQFARGNAPMQGMAQNALQDQQELAQAGRLLPQPNGYAGHSGGYGAGALTAVLAEHALENPKIAIGGAMAYPFLQALYSDPSRRFLNGIASSMPSLAPIAPTAAGLFAPPVARSGLLP